MADISDGYTSDSINQFSFHGFNRREFFGVKSDNSLEIHNKISFNNTNNNNNNNCNNILIDNQKSTSVLRDSYPQKFSKHKTEDSIQMTDIKVSIILYGFIAFPF